MKSRDVESAPRLNPADGVEIILIGDGKRLTLTKITCSPGSLIQDHSHPNEQSGTCIEGEGILTSGGKQLRVVPGVAWTIPGDEIHSFEATGKSNAVIIEAFSPPREDYKKMAK